MYQILLNKMLLDWIALKIGQVSRCFCLSQIYLGTYKEKDFCLLVSFTWAVVALTLIVQELQKKKFSKQMKHQLQPYKLLRGIAVSSNSHCFGAQKMYLFSVALHYLASFKQPVKDQLVLIVTADAAIQVKYLAVALRYVT